MGPARTRREPARRAIGFRIKSGYAVAVVLVGPAAEPAIVDHRRVELSDPNAVETRQPFHRGTFKEESDDAEIARRVGIVERCAAAAMSRFLAQAGRAPAALVVGSVIDPDRVGNPHIRAHAQEGRLFRTVVERALAAHGIRFDVILEKALDAKACAALGLSADQIKRTVAQLGKTAGGPWRSDEKSAATAAWMALS